MGRTSMRVPQSMKIRRNSPALADFGWMLPTKTVRCCLPVPSVTTGMLVNRLMISAAFPEAMWTSSEASRVCTVICFSKRSAASNFFRCLWVSPAAGSSPASALRFCPRLGVPAAVSVSIGAAVSACGGAGPSPSSWARSAARSALRFAFLSAFFNARISESFSFTGSSLGYATSESNTDQSNTSSGATGVMTFSLVETTCNFAAGARPFGLVLFFLGAWTCCSAIRLGVCLLPAAFASF
mmetsp:Transcript_151862/g.265321  ORF Transcript_151862/g.265321 Transcript_151862/m.265321 type:complete len:240 (-) Transcript_151862:304-1023(-)